MRKISIALIMALVLVLSQVSAQEKTPRGAMTWTEKSQDSDTVYRIEENVVQQGSCGMGMMCHQMMDLTEEQQEKVKTIRMGSAQELLAMKGKMEVLSAELRNLMIAENPDRKAIDKKIDEMEGIRAEIKKKRIGTDLEVQKLFTPEQRLKWKQGILGGSKCCGMTGAHMQGMNIRQRSERPVMERKMRKLVRPVPDAPEKDLEVIIEKK